ncbi:hypothetical protein C8R45DRAFT_1024125 [Mycena sanguinolenta]|nr:hypothetical protein C8R45DRAFT_1024125 [Mycena sanguinolenta]
MPIFAYFLTLGLLAVEARAACADASQAQPLYRDWNPATSDHFFTTDSAEASGASGYNFEGVKALVFTTQVAGSVRFLRLDNVGTGHHFYTCNATEAAVAPGFVIEDKDPMYIYPTQLCGSVPLYRLYASSVGDHFYTVNTTERDGAEQSGWGFEWIAGYVFPPPDASTGSTTSQPPAQPPPTSSATLTTTPPASPPSPSLPPPNSNSKTASSASPLSNAAQSTSSSNPFGTSDPVDVLPAPTSILGGTGTGLDATVPSASSSTPPGTSAGTCARFHPMSYLAAAVAIILCRWL